VQWYFADMVRVRVFFGCDLLYFRLVAVLSSAEALRCQIGLNSNFICRDFSGSTKRHKFLNFACKQACGGRSMSSNFFLNFNYCSKNTIFS